MKHSTLNTYKDKIIELYNKNYGCPEIHKLLELPVSIRQTQRYLKELGLIRTPLDALKLSENRRIDTIQRKWDGYEPKYKRSPLGLAQRLRIFERDNFKCKLCGVSVADGAVIETDHIIAVMDGGTNDDSNLQTICRQCNAGKYFLEHPHTNDLLK